MKLKILDQEWTLRGVEGAYYVESSDGHTVCQGTNFPEMLMCNAAIDLYRACFDAIKTIDKVLEELRGTKHNSEPDMASLRSTMLDTLRFVREGDVKS